MKAPLSFGTNAANLAAHSAQTLGWLPADFWYATPADLSIALKLPSSNQTGLNRTELETLLESDRHG